MEEKAGHNVLILGNKCYRCDHTWVQREADHKPIACPGCKSPYWWRPKTRKNGKRKKI